MTVFSKYSLLGDLIVTPIAQAIQALPTDLMLYIGNYVEAPDYTEFKARYHKLKAVGRKIRNRTKDEWLECAKAQFWVVRGFLKLENPDHRSYARHAIKEEVRTQYKKYKKELNNYYFGCEITVAEYF